MALSDEVQSRYSTEYLKSLTNQGASGTPSSIDTTKLGKAATDTQAAFERLAKVIYDNDNSVHVEMCVEGVMAKLLVWADPVSNKPAWERFEDSCRALNEGNILEPYTNSQIEPEEPDASVTQRFRNKESHFDDFLPGQNDGSSLAEI